MPVPVAVVSTPKGTGPNLNHFAPGKGQGPGGMGSLDTAEMAVLEKIAKLYGITLPQAYKIAQDANLDLRKSWDDQGKSAQQAEDRVSAEAAVLKLMHGRSGEATRAMSDYTASLRLNGAASTETIGARHQLYLDLRHAGLKAGEANDLIGKLSAGIHQGADNINATHPSRKSLVDDLVAAGMKASAAKGDVGDYTRAVRNNGADSDQARTARQHLINDLEKAGLNAKQAAKLVDGLGTSVGKLHGKHLSVDVKGSGVWSISQFTKSLNPGPGPKIGPAAAGMLVSGGIPGVDSVPILAQRDELVVPVPIVKSGAVDHLRGMIPGFASGGVVGRSPGTPRGHREVGAGGVRLYGAGH